MKQKTIKAIGTFVPRTNFQDGERYNKFGLGELIRIILNNAYGVGMFGQGSDIRKIFENKLENFFTRLETDLPTIKKRQALFAALLEDTELVTFLITRRYPEFPNSDRDRDVESSRLNDAVAIDSISYLDELSRLIAKNPAYARLRSILSGICKDAPWLEQMRSLAENSLQYSKYGIKARFKIFTDYDGSEEKQLKFESSSYKLDFFTNKVSVPMYSRMSIRTDIRKMKRKVQLDYIRVDQKNNLVSDDLWRGLIMKALSSETLQKMWTLKKETFGVSVQIKVDAISGSTEAVVKFDGQKSAEFIYLLAKNPKYDWETESYRWLAVGEEYFPGEEKRLPDFLDSVENFKNAHLFAGSRSFIYSYMKEFKNLFSSLDELLMLGAIANFYQKNSGKWVMPKMLPMESMITDIVGGMNPLFFTKGKGVSIPNNISFAKDSSGFLITGANTGGKTGYTNMYAMNQMLAQSGFPVFAESATLSIKDKILCHYVESDDIGVNLSRYQSELHRLKHIVEEMTQYSVILFDEPFSGTGVESGTYQAYEVLKMLSKVGCVFIMNTHLHDLVDMVGKNGTSSVVNMHFMLPNSEKPKDTDYKIQPGGTKISQGEAIALSEKVDYRSMMKTLRKRKVVVSSL